ncbi:alpha/beta hydrolase [Streptomyces sp. NPDC051963]|uniref:alpha/beta hydrolase n=1 Tax=Streptomyces sp. NPDC051963 TaxID=3365678 RepID=UPI0037D98730
MTDYLAFARAAGCEPAVVDSFASLGGIVAGLPDLESPDWARRRRAARELSDALATRFTLPGPTECEVTEHRVPTRAGKITVVHYRPPHADGPRTAHLAFHGGGFVLGSVHEVVNERIARSRAVAGGIDIFDVGYRLAPEHPFPAGLEDCLDALTWLIESAGEFGIDPDRIGVGGVSAGGNLAGLVAVHARDRGLRLDHQVLEVPGVSLDFEQDDSYRAYSALGDFGADIADLHAAYLGVSGPAEGWAAPAEVPDLTGLPPALVITAELDPLRDSGEAYATRLAEAGVPVRTWRAPGQLHGSGALTRTSAIAREWQDRVGEFLRSRARRSASIPY